MRPRMLWMMGVLAAALATPVAHAATLDPRTLTKYVDPLPVPGAMPMAGPNHYEIGAYQIQQQLHSQLPPTTVYGYGTSEATASYPGATIVARRNVPITVRWTNHLPATHLLQYAIDPTLPRALTTTGVPIVTHVHGAEVEPQSDGGPMTWFTAGFAERGESWTKETLSYANTQLPATIWYHDHAFGYTRHNVYAGLAGFYLVTDPGSEPPGLPTAPYDMGLAIQDRMFTTDGQLWYPNEGESEVHPTWIPEFFGDVILVNGKIWPYQNVEPRKYRFRILDGSNARFYSLALEDMATGARGPAFQQIGTDGGYLGAPVLLNDPADPHAPRLLLAPGERADVIIDFSAYAPGARLLLRNTAKAPFPKGDAPDPQTVGQIMQFRVVPLTAPDPSVVPASLTTIDRLGLPSVTRVMTLNEQLEDGVPVGAFLNGMPFEEGATEFPELGATEMWEIVNMTGDTHPIHLHLVQFQLLNRQRINLKNYERAFQLANPELPSDHYVPVPADWHLRGRPVPPDANERGWKDTFRMNPGEVTRILVRFAPQDGTPAYAFDATAEPGYVWHCHILEHEENDMMRPYHLVAPASPVVQRGPEAPGGQATQVGGSAAALFAPTPNPTDRSAAFRVWLSAPSQVDLGLYGIDGRRVRRISTGALGAGEHQVQWDGLDDSGRPLAAGVYFVSMRANGVSATRRLLVRP